MFACTRSLDTPYIRQRCSELVLTVLDSIIAELRQQSKDVNSGREEIAAERDMNFHRSTLRCLQLRSRALEDRLRNEINLVSECHKETDDKFRHVAVC